MLRDAYSGRSKLRRYCGKSVAISPRFTIYPRGSRADLTLAGRRCRWWAAGASETGVWQSSGLFEEIQVRRYVWEKHYTAEEYITLLNTFSGHIAMDEAKREHLYQEIRQRVTLRR